MYPGQIMNSSHMTDENLLVFVFAVRNDIVADELGGHSNYKVSAFVRVAQ